MRTLAYTYIHTHAHLHANMLTDIHACVHMYTQKNHTPMSCEFSFTHTAMNKLRVNYRYLYYLDLSIYSSVGLSVCLSVCLSVYLSTCKVYIYIHIHIETRASMHGSK